MRLFDLNPQQLDAVRSTEGPVLILAGAGSGKTRVITSRIAYLLHQGVSPEAILAVTFTNKAAREMRDRVAGLAERSDIKKLTISTFHSFCVRILRQDIERLGYKTTFSIYDESDQLGLIRKVIQRLAAKNEKLDAAVARNFITRAKCQPWNTVPKEDSLVAAVFHRYQQELKDSNALDFDDLLRLTVQLFEEFTEERMKWQQRYQYIMVDEFQDTNELQLHLICSLSNSNVCVVGDDDQSIYGWRGANIANILEFEKHFPNPQIIKLEQNYRSTNAILGAANSIIRHSPRRRPKTLWSERGDGEKVRVVLIPDDHEEANFVVSEIQRLQVTERTPWTDFAVIFRMNTQSRLIEENLRRLRIPYRVFAGRSYFERREVKDIISYLNCLVNPQDDSSLLRIINTPARGIGSTTIQLAIEQSNLLRRSVYDTLQSPELNELLNQRTKNTVQHFVQLVDRFETKVSEPLVNLGSVVEELLTEIDYFADLRRACKTLEEAYSREENVRELFRSLASYQKRSTDGLPGFLAEVALDQDKEEEVDKEGVTLLTFHAAKGLEFNHVFLIGLEEGLLPHDRSKMEGGLDEERRLLYVGITRARQTLTITYCQSRQKFGSASPCHPSSFLKDLDTNFVDFTNYHELTSQPAGEETARFHFAKMRELLG